MTDTTPRPGDYICIRTGGLAAALIRAVTRSPFNHVAIVADRGQLIEAEPGGVTRNNLIEYDGHLTLTNTAEPTTPQQRAIILNYATTRLSTPYNWDADIADGLDHLGWHWRALTRLAGARKALMCSQLVATAGVLAGLPSWQCGKPTTSAVVPGDLAERIEKHQWQ